MWKLLRQLLQNLKAVISRQNVKRVLRLKLKNGLFGCMQMTGCARLTDIDRSCVTHE